MSNPIRVHIERQNTKSEWVVSHEVLGVGARQRAVEDVVDHAVADSVRSARAVVVDAEGKSTVLATHVGTASVADEAAQRDLLGAALRYAAARVEEQRVALAAVDAHAATLADREVEQAARSLHTMALLVGARD